VQRKLKVEVRCRVKFCQLPEIGLRQKTLQDEVLALDKPKALELSD